MLGKASFARVGWFGYKMHHGLVCLNTWSPPGDVFWEAVNHLGVGG